MILVRDIAPPRRVALLPGSFNPPTQAHLALALAALDHTGAVVFVLPRAFPHKGWEGADREQRTSMLLRIAERDTRLGVGLSEGGLFVEMAREAHALWPGAQVEVLCGRDAAERILTWEYADGDSIEKQLEEFQLLVAEREGRLEAPPQVQGRIRHLACSALDEVSSTDVRRRCAAGLPWRHLVPQEIHDTVAAIYS